MSDAILDHLTQRKPDAAETLRSENLAHGKPETEKSCQRCAGMEDGSGTYERLDAELRTASLSQAFWLTLRKTHGTDS